MRTKIYALLLGLMIPLTVYAGLETSTYIDGLIATNPLATDPSHQGDDHLRLIKSTIKNTFPNINAAMTLTDETLNALPTLAHGTYTPTAGCVANCGSVSGFAHQYSRVGNTVTVGGSVNLSATSGAGVLTTVSVTLPIASNFNSTQNANGGGGVDTATGAPIFVYADGGSDTAYISYRSTTSGAQTGRYTFVYVVQ